MMVSFFDMLTNPNLATEALELEHLNNVLKKERNEAYDEADKLNQENEHLRAAQRLQDSMITNLHEQIEQLQCDLAQAKLEGAK